jgi:uncharacterized protein YjgD (DUF1641 family)
MANPITELPRKVVPRQELERRLAAAPMQHAEAILVAFDLLEEAHAQGLLDMLHGAVGSKDAIFGKLAEYARQPLSTQALRNLLILGKLFGSIDPEALIQVAAPAAEDEPPSLWKIFKQIRSKDARRGLSIAVMLLSSLGHSADETTAFRSQTK